MGRLQRLPLLLALLPALLCTLLLLHAAHADALSLAYDRNYGTAYVTILQSTADVPIEAQGYTRRQLELFQDRRVDAAEVYDFQAEQFLRGAAEELYWYPHYTATVVLAVRTDPRIPVHGWADLREGVTIAMPEQSPEREIFFLALTQGLSANRDTAFAHLAQMKAEGRLRFYAMHRGTWGILANAGANDVYVLFAHEAERLIRRGAQLRIVVPAEGTLTLTKGVLSRAPITFSETLPRELDAAGYPPLPPSAAAVHAMPPDFPQVLRTVNTRYHAQIMERPVFMPAEEHERFMVLVLMLPLTVIWGAYIYRRVLHHGARRAVVLLVAMLLLWELTRMVKILTFVHDSALERMLWYLFYVFRAGLSVALLWIAWSADEDAINRRMPPWLKAVFGLNLLLAALILCNDYHQQFFAFTWDNILQEWQEELAWGAYVYWTLWFGEILAALLLLLEKAKQQQVLRPMMMLPFVFFALFVVYSIAYQYVAWVQWPELTALTALFFLALLEICLHTGLMPSNRLHEAFFTHAQLAMRLVNAEGAPVFASALQWDETGRDTRTSRMEIHGGALLWQEDLRLLHERQRQLALACGALERSHTLLRAEHTIRRKLLALTLRRNLSEELEAILAAKRPLLRRFREELMETQDEEQIVRLIRRLNLLSSYLKKRCVLFLKGQEDGTVRTDELAMAVSETCTYLRPLGLHVGVEWAQTELLYTETALALFDAFAEFLTRAAAAGMEHIFCRFTDDTLTFLLEGADWIAPWAAAWQEEHGTAVTTEDRGYARTLTIRPTAAVGKGAGDQAAYPAEDARRTQDEERRDVPWND